MCNWFVRDQCAYPLTLHDEWNIRNVRNVFSPNKIEKKPLSFIVNIFHVFIYLFLEMVVFMLCTDDVCCLSTNFPTRYTFITIPKCEFVLHGILNDSQLYCIKSEYQRSYHRVTLDSFYFLFGFAHVEFVLCMPAYACSRVLSHLNLPLFSFISLLTRNISDAFSYNVSM